MWNRMLVLDELECIYWNEIDAIEQTWNATSCNIRCHQRRKHTARRHAYPRAHDLSLRMFRAHNFSAEYLQNTCFSLDFSSMYNHGITDDICWCVSMRIPHLCSVRALCTHMHATCWRRMHYQSLSHPISQSRSRYRVWLSRSRPWEKLAFASFISISDSEQNVSVSN